MTLPDANTSLIILFNCCGWVIIWFKKDRRAAKMTAVQEYQHGKMWKQFEKEHGINGNGG